MYYVCVESGAVTSILNYKPNVPATVAVVSISDQDYQKLTDSTHVFDVQTMKVVSAPESQLLAQQIEQQNRKHLKMLDDSDWKVLRHIRQQALGMPTTLSEEEYIELERQRQIAADSIIQQ